MKFFLLLGCFLSLGTWPVCAMDMADPETADGASIAPSPPVCAKKNTPFPPSLKGKVTPALIIPDSPDDCASAGKKSSMLYITYQEDMCKICYVGTPQPLPSLAGAISRQAGDLLHSHHTSDAVSYTLDDMFDWLIATLIEKKISTAPHHALFINDPMALADPRHTLDSQRLTHVMFTKSNNTPHRLLYLSAPLTSVTYVARSAPLFWDVERFPKLNHIHTQTSPFFFPGYFLNTSIVRNPSWENRAPSFAYAGRYVGYRDLGKQPRTGVKSHIAFFAREEDPWGIGAQHCTITYPSLQRYASAKGIHNNFLKTCEGTNHWNTLPNELVENIMFKLSGRDLITFKNVCKRFQRIVLGKRSNEKFCQDMLIHSLGFDLLEHAGNALFKAPFVTISNNLEVRSKEGLYDCRLSLSYDQGVVTQENIRADFSVHTLSGIASSAEDQAFYQRIDLTLFPGTQPDKKLLTVGPFYRHVLEESDERLQLSRQLQLIMVASKLIADDWNAKTLR